MAKQDIKFKIIALDTTKAVFRGLNKGLMGTARLGKTAALGVAKVGVAATAAGAALGALAKVNIDFLDRLGKTASKLGITAEFLQELRFAADQTGVGIAAIDMGLQRFIRRVAEARQGTGEAKRALEQLGISVTDSNGNLKSTKQLFFEVADGIANTTDEAERVRLAFKFFDSEGVALVETMRNGSQGLKDFADQAENLGIIISGDTVKKAEAFKDTLGRLKNQLTAITSSVIGAVLPVFDDFSLKLSEILGNLKKDDKTFENFGKDIAVSILHTLNNVVIGIQKMFNGLKLEFLSFAASRVGQLMFGEMITEADKANIRILEIQKEMQKMNEQGFFMKKGMGGIAEVFGKDTEEFTQKLKDLFTEAMSLSEQFGDSIILGSEQGIEGFDELIKKILEFNSTVDEINEGDPPTSKMSEQVSAFVDTLGSTQDNISQLTINTMKNFEDRIVEGLRNGKLAFKDFADYVIEQILRIAIQEAIIKPITGRVESFFSGMFGGNKSLGGSVKAGNAYMVGETGRELFIPNQNGQILSNTDLRQSGGQAATVNFNISTVDAAGFDELLATRKNMIVSMVNQAYNSRGKMGVV